MENVNVYNPSVKPDFVYKYFSKLGLELRTAFRMHITGGLWEKGSEGKRNWRNVSEHCLVEAARADVFSELLEFPADLRMDLKLAAVLSDYYKRRGKENTEGNTDPEKALDQAESKSHSLLEKGGFNKRTIFLTDSTSTFQSVKVTIPTLLKKDELRNDEVAYLVLHYIDDYSIGSDWVVPAEVLPDGTYKNAFDRRTDDVNSRYPELKASGFNDKEREIGRAVEEGLARILSSKLGTFVEPKLIPEMIEEKIIEKIYKLEIEK